VADSQTEWDRKYSCDAFALKAKGKESLLTLEQIKAELAAGLQQNHPDVRALYQRWQQADKDKEQKAKGKEGFAIRLAELRTLLKDKQLVVPPPREKDLTAKLVSAEQDAGAAKTQMQHPLFMDLDTVRAKYGRSQYAGA